MLPFEAVVALVDDRVFWFHDQVAQQNAVLPSQPLVQKHAAHPGAEAELCTIETTGPKEGKFKRKRELHLRGHLLWRRHEG
jgi:hypothetical protein